MNEPYKTRRHSPAHSVTNQIIAVKDRLCAALDIDRKSFNPEFLDEKRLKFYRQFDEFAVLAVYILNTDGTVKVPETANLWYDLVPRPQYRDQATKDQSRSKSAAIAWRALSLVEQPRDIKVVKLQTKGGTEVRLGYRWVSLDYKAYAGCSVNDARAGISRAKGNFQLAGLEVLMACVYYMRDYFGMIEREDTVWPIPRMAGLDYADSRGGRETSVAIDKPFGQRFHIGVASRSVGGDEWVANPIVEVVKA